MSAEKIAFDFAFELRDRYMTPVAFDKTYFSLETFHESGLNDSHGAQTIENMNEELEPKVNCKIILQSDDGVSTLCA